MKQLAPRIAEVAQNRESLSLTEVEINQQRNAFHIPEQRRDDDSDPNRQVETLLCAWAEVYPIDAAPHSLQAVD